MLTGAVLSRSMMTALGTNTPLAGRVRRRGLKREYTMGIDEQCSISSIILRVLIVDYEQEAKQCEWGAGWNFAQHITG